jgi:hypothetical protein
LLVLVAAGNELHRGLGAERGAGVKGPRRHPLSSPCLGCLCIGNLLARIASRVALEELFRRLPEREVDGPVVRLQSNWMNGVKRMPVRLNPYPRFGAGRRFKPLF